MGYHEEVDEADYTINLANWRQQPIGPRWLGRLSVYMFGGFGHRPYRLIYLIIFANLIIALLYQLAVPRTSFEQSIWYSINGYFAVPDRTDFMTKGLAEKSLIISQALFALFANSTLLALLVKRWFRS